jgi:multiple sugar transport system ATP-binding protein
MAEVVLDRLSKTYPNDVEALRAVTLRVGEGELVVLVGPSGCGKTTTLRLIAGLERPSGGRVSVAGRDVTAEPPHRRDVGMVFQRPAVYPDLTVEENLAFGLAVRQGGWRRWLPRGRALANRPHAERVAEVADLLGLTDLLRRRPAELSGGQQQRVALGRALARRPAVFLLDEPLSHLDPPLRWEMRRQLHLLQRRLRATMLYVTHDQEEALTLGDRVIVLDRGAVQQDAPPGAVYNCPANRFVARFLGWPPINTLDGTLVEDGGLRFRGGGTELPVPAACQLEWRKCLGKALTLGLRPEHVRPRAAVDAGDGTVQYSAVCTMETRLVERSGPTCLVTLQRGSWLVQARLERGAAPAEGSTVAVELGLGRAHLFDGASGTALVHGRPDG